MTSHQFSIGLDKLIKLGADVYTNNHKDICALRKTTEGHSWLGQKWTTSSWC